jgi:thymidylate synthase
VTVLVHGQNCLDAWLNASQHLIGHRGEEFNLVVTVDDPVQFEDEWLVRFNPRSVSSEGDAIRDVMNTIFPSKTRANAQTRAAFYDRYKRAFDRRRRRHRTWGTYFHRLIAFGPHATNQLENAIDALGRWGNNHKAALVLHLSSCEVDRIRIMGGPCWQYGALLCPDDETVNLTVVYRNHDYFNKALGNLLGLSRLLQFIAEESGRGPGQLVCHSAHAYFDGSRTTMKNLIAR